MRQLSHEESQETSALDSDDENDKMDSNEIVILQIGERRFTSYKRTLCKSQYFAALLSDNFSDKRADGSYFIDRDGSDFEYLLHFLRCGYVQVPSEKALTIHLEALYYQIPMDFSEALRILSLKQLSIYPGISIKKAGFNKKGEWEDSRWEVLINGKRLLDTHDQYGMTIDQVYKLQSNAGSIPNFICRLTKCGDYEFHNDTHRIFWLKPRVPKTFMIKCDHP